MSAPEPPDVPAGDAPATGAPATDAPATGAPGIEAVPATGRPDDASLRPGVEAVLFLADEPVDTSELAEVLERAPDEIEAVVTALAEEHAAAGRGIAIERVGGGWRMFTATAARPVLERWALAGRTGRLTQAALETLAVVAYKQPISRQEISDIRGVNADGAVRSLVARGFVAPVGRDDGPGQAVRYGTTTILLERLGIDSLDELPPLTDYLPEAPAPDEPDLGALKEVRRRLQAGGDLPVRGGDATTNTGPDAFGDEDEDVLPAPTTAVGGRDDAGMDELTERLERAARSAVEQLRSAVAASEDPDDEPADGADEAAADGVSDGASGAASDGADRDGDGPDPGVDDRGTARHDDPEGAGAAAEDGGSRG